jgi:D-aspartate ligase
MRTNLTLPTAVIVGMEANGLGVARALWSHRIPSIGLATPQWNPCWQTKACTVVPCPSWTEEGLIAALMSVGKRLDRKAPLIITKDEPVIWISKFRTELSQFFELSLPDPDVVDLLMNKASFADMAKAEGWPIPVSWNINNRDDLHHVLTEFSFPCVLKPRVKNSAFRNSPNRKAYKVCSASELVERYDLVAQWESEVVVQEWIEGGDDRIAFCLTYCDRSGKPLALFSGMKLRQWPIEVGNTAMAQAAPQAWVEPILALTERIWQRVGFRGVGSVEYKMRLGSDEPVITEPTVGRTNYQNEVAVINGINIPAIAYCDLARIPQLSAHVPVRPVKLVDGPREVMAAAASVRAGSLSLFQWLKDRRGTKRYMIFRADDAGPFAASLLVGLKDLLAALVELVVGRRLKHSLARLARSLIWEWKKK